MIVSIIFWTVLFMAVDIVNTIFDPTAEFVNRYPVFSIASDMGSYQIDPQTILASLDNNKTNVFLSLAETPDDPLEQSPILWQQSDYLKIAAAAFDSQWDESQNGWNLNRMIFYTDCQYFSKGFDYATFTYYKGNWNGMELTYLGRKIDISPQYHVVNWYGEAMYYPPLFSFEKGIDLKNIKFDSSGAIQLAENNGGKAARVAVNNKCSIYLILDGSEKKGWDIVYHGDESKFPVFEIYIDPYTGKIHQK